MKRHNPRRTSATVQIILTNWLNTRSVMRIRSRPAQIRAAAKKMQRAGLLPLEVAKRLGLVKKAA